jgi:hypothetical protein
LNLPINGRRRVQVAALLIGVDAAVAVGVMMGLARRREGGLRGEGGAGGQWMNRKVRGSRSMIAQHHSRHLPVPEDMIARMLLMLNRRGSRRCVQAYVDHLEALSLDHATWRNLISSWFQIQFYDRMMNLKYFIFNDIEVSSQ